MDDLKAMSANRHEYGPEEVRFGVERLNRGDSLAIGESCGETVFYAWLMYGRVDLDQRVIVPTVADVVYSYRVFTIAEARRHRICAAYYSHIRTLLARSGYRELVCRVGCSNAGSIRAHNVAGFRAAGRVWKLVTPWRSFYRVDDGLRIWAQLNCRPGQFSPSGWLLEGDEA
jgi:hypothetical protein